MFSATSLVFESKKLSSHMGVVLLWKETALCPRDRDRASGGERVGGIFADTDPKVFGTKVLAGNFFWDF